MPQGIGTSWKRPGYEHGHQDSRHCLGDDGDFLLLSIHVALGAIGDDAAVIRGFRSQFDGRRVDLGAVLLRIFAIQSCRGRCDGSARTEAGSPDCRGCGRRRGAAVRDRPQRSGERGQSTSGSRRSVCTGGSHLHRHQKLSAVACSYFDRRYPDVRNGRRVGRAVCGWANDRRGDRLGPFLDRYGHCRLGDGCPSISFPTETEKRTKQSANGLRSTTDAFYTVFKNPQSILCGVIAGLLFIPTTIFDMVWGVRYLQEAHGFDYASAVMRTAAVPFGWIIGCPLLGFISDRLGRRKPVIIGGALLLFACLAWILFGRPGVLPPYAVGLMAGVASGAAMLPYTVIKESNPPQFGGTATGVMNFLNFTFSALLGPVFGWMLQLLSGGAGPMQLEHYQMAFAAASLGRRHRDCPRLLSEGDRLRDSNIFL